MAVRGRVTLNIPAIILLAGVGASQLMSFGCSPRFQDQRVGVRDDE